MLLEKEANHIRRLTLNIILLFVLAGCVPLDKGVHIQNDTKADMKKAEEIFKADDRLTSTVAIFHEKEVIAGVSVKAFSKFRKPKIEKELKEKLEKEYKEFDITVSADSKAAYETVKLMELEDKDKLKKKIKKLKSLLEEET